MPQILGGADGVGVGGRWQGGDGRPVTEVKVTVSGVYCAQRSAPAVDPGQSFPVLRFNGGEDSV